MLFLLATIRGRDRDQRTYAFVAVGLVAIAIEDHIKPYLSKILELIRSFLPSKVFLNNMFIVFFLNRLVISNYMVYYCINHNNILLNFLTG